MNWINRSSSLQMGLALCVSLAGSATWADPQPVSFLQPIENACKYNDNQAGNINQIKAVVAGNSALYRNAMGWVQSFSLSALRSYGSPGMYSSSMNPLASDFVSGASVSVNFTKLIIDGGANKALDQARAESARSQAALLASTNTYTPYTMGSLATQTASLYATLEFFKVLTSTLQEAANVGDMLEPKISDPLGRSMFKGVFSNIKIQLETMNSQIASQLISFKNSAAEDYPANIENLQSAVARLGQILKPYLDPDRLESTMDFARQNNRDYLSALYASEAADKSMLGNSIARSHDSEQLQAGLYVGRGKLTYSSSGGHPQKTLLGAELVYSSSWGVQGGVKSASSKDKLTKQAAHSFLQGQEGTIRVALTQAFEAEPQNDQDLAAYQAIVAQAKQVYDQKLAVLLAQTEPITNQQMYTLASLVTNSLQARIAYAAKLQSVFISRFQLLTTIGLLYNEIDVKPYDPTE